MGGNSDKTTHASVSPLIMLYRSTPEIWTKSEFRTRFTANKGEPKHTSVQHRSTENSTYTCISPAQKHWELNLHLHQSSTEALRTQPTPASVQHRSTENSTYICISPAQKHWELNLHLHQSSTEAPRAHANKRSKTSTSKTALTATGTHECPGIPFTFKVPPPLRKRLFFLTAVTPEWELLISVQSHPKRLGTVANKNKK